MSMVGRPTIRQRLIVLATMAATLLSAWQPASRACACGTIAESVKLAAPEPPRVCPCCGDVPTVDEPLPPCCQNRKSDQTGDPKGCSCAPVSPPGNSEPTAPPRPADSDDNIVLTAGDPLLVADDLHPPAGPSTAALVVSSADLPPTDLVISLSRLTC
jgi:hypothetical protein